MSGRDKGENVKVGLLSNPFIAAGVENPFCVLKVVDENHGTEALSVSNFDCWRMGED